MADVLTQAQRSYCMAQIRGKNTKPELVVRSALHRLGLRFRIHDGKLPGRPDLVFARHRAVVFVDGDFWHGRRFGAWKHKLTPIWRKKIDGNRKRDIRNRLRLRRLGWTVVRVWESELKRDTIGTIARVKAILSHST